jgi:hypothetical protein
MQDSRIIYNSIDYSAKFNDFRETAQAFAYTAGAYVYIGSIAPFNNLWFELGTVNSSAKTPTVCMWWAGAWHDAVDVIDETVGMTGSGRLSWNTDRLKGWDLEQTTEDVTGITAFKIYHRYWLRLSWSGSFSAGTTLKYIGQKFATDDILYSFYPDLAITDIKTGFEANKTTWDEQHFMAVEHIVRDLKKRSIIQSRSQIMDWHLFQDAACHKVAEIVYQAFGEPYSDQLKRAAQAYDKALDVKYFSVDRNANGALDPAERTMSTIFGTR